MPARRVRPRTGAGSNPTIRRTASGAVASTAGAEKRRPWPAARRAPAGRPARPVRRHGPAASPPRPCAAPDGPRAAARGPTVRRGSVHEERLSTALRNRERSAGRWRPWPGPGGPGARRPSSSAVPALGLRGGVGDRHARREGGVQQVEIHVGVPALLAQQPHRLAVGDQPGRQPLHQGELLDEPLALPPAALTVPVPGAHPVGRVDRAVEQQTDRPAGVEQREPRRVELLALITARGRHQRQQPLPYRRILVRQLRQSGQRGVPEAPGRAVHGPEGRISASSARSSARGSSPAPFASRRRSSSMPA